MDTHAPDRTATDPLRGNELAGPTAPQSQTPLLDRVRSPQDLRRLSQGSLTRLATELRADLIDIVSTTGGHLGAGLGVVELTIALHYAFNTPDDKLLWDVSHQCYPHKILTGRRDAMRRIRQADGPSGFTSRAESVCDPFGAAHSSTAISAGLGFATARDLAGDNFNVVAVVGDGAMSGGMAFEGLNNAGALNRPLIIVLNDNNMSIAPPSGALSNLLTSLRARMPAPAERRRALRRGPLPSFAGGRTLFDDLGVRYIGPFDGHDVDELVDIFSRVQNEIDGPVIIHVVTEKGKGYQPAERAADKYHGVSPFNVSSGVQSKATAKAPSYTNVFAKALIDEASRDSRIVAVSAAMPTGTGLDKFGQAFPDRCFDTGIAEQHAVTFCAGLAAQGFRPFAAIYSTFLQRGYDQIVHDVAIQRLPVRFAIDRAGLVGADGVTHQGSYDIAYLGCLPGFVLMAAADEAELMHMVATAVAIDDRPSAFRFPRGDGRGVELPKSGEPLVIGRGRIIREGAHVAILSYGSRLGAALGAAERLERMGVSATIADARFAKPIDDALVARLLRDHAVVLSLEEGSVGGFATQVYDSVRRQGLEALAPRLLPLHLPDYFVDHDTPARQETRAGLDADSIATRAFEALRARDPAFKRSALRAAE